MPRILFTRILKNSYYTAQQKYFILKYFFDSVSKPSKVFFIGKIFVGDYIQNIG